MGEKEMGVIADLITQVLKEPESETNLSQVRQKVLELCARFPLHQDLMD
jgi:glycine/serine hydroxymethyltransferase